MLKHVENYCGKIWRNMVRLAKYGSLLYVEYSTSSLNFVLGRSENKDCHPGRDISTYMQLHIIIWRNLTWSKYSTSSTIYGRLYFSDPMEYNHGFWLAKTSETAEWRLTKLDMQQVLNVLYEGCASSADRKTKMTALASDWLRYFRLLYNRWEQFDESWQEASAQRTL